MSQKKLQLILLIGSFLFCIVIAEIFLRFYSRSHPLTKIQHGDSIQHNGNPGMWHKNLHHAPIPSWRGFREVSKTDRLDKIRKTPLMYNSMGFRGKEPGIKSGKRVLLIGDSFLEADELPLSNTLGYHLNEEFSKNGIQFIQHGYTSWSPLLEFAWMYHVGHALEFDRVYMFIYDNDFLSHCSFSKSDSYYRKEYKFGKDGEPLFIPSLSPGLFWKVSYLARYIEGNLIHWLKPKLKNQIRLFKENIPLSHKIKRITDRTLHGIPIYPPDCPEIYLNPSPTFLSVIYKEKFAWDKRDHVEGVMYRLPRTEWDEILSTAYEDTMNSIYDFNRYLKSINSELIVVYVPASFEIDFKEHNSPNLWRDSLKNFPKGEQGLEMSIRNDLASRSIPFVSLEASLQEYKQKNCPNCENFLHFKHEGHWNANAHKAVSRAINSHLLKNPIK